MEAQPEQALTKTRNGAAPALKVNGLTPRERQVVRLACDPDITSAAEIGRRLELNRVTILHHLTKSSVAEAILEGRKGRLDKGRGILAIGDKVVHKLAESIDDKSIEDFNLPEITALLKEWLPMRKEIAATYGQADLADSKAWKRALRRAAHLGRVMLLGQLRRAGKLHNM